MSRFSICSLLLLLLAVAPSRADEHGDMLLPESQKDTVVSPCKEDAARLPGCKDGSLSGLARAADAAFKAALAKAQPATAVLLKRDQVWFGEIVENLSQNVAYATVDQQQKIGPALQRRRTLLGDIAQGLGRNGVVGHWVNAFGTIEITPAADGAFRVALATEAIYGPDDVQQQSCKGSALVRPGAEGWLVGDADAPANMQPGDGNKPSPVRIRLQGETLRVIAGDEMHKPSYRDDLPCSGSNQLTGSYFPAGKSGSSGKSAPFAAPTFDCAHPATASDEEICADPELAANDLRLNRAWKALLPRLDEATRRLLTDDQRAWVKTQGIRYPDQLHPPSAKQSYFVHWTALARVSLAEIQNERIAMLEGFDEKRRGFEGNWSAYNATLSVTREKNGTLSATGNKWFEDDYRGGCDYDFSGKVDGDVFHPKDTSKNPDSMELDHGSLIVNRADDEWAKRRDKPAADEGKCKRSPLISSTARLFPVRPSPDLGDSSR